MEYNHQRVAVFVDVQNMYHSAKNLYNANVNFTELLKDAVGNRQLIRAIAYVVRAEGPKEQSFFDALEKTGYELKVKDIQIYAGGAKKADWDIGMAIDALTISKHVDVVVLITGDGDFIPLISYLQNNEGTLVEVVAFGRSCSSRMIEWTDKFMDLEHHPEKYLLGYNPPASSSSPPTLARRSPDQSVGAASAAAPSDTKEEPKTEKPKSIDVSEL